MKRSIGIYVGRKEVIAASVSLQKDIPTLGQFAIEPIEAAAGPIELAPKREKEKAKVPLTAEAQTIHRALRKVGAPRGCVIAAFNPFQLVTRYFQMPFIPPREWADTLRYEASRYIPFKLSETVSDYKIQEREGDPQTRELSVTVTAAKIEVLRSYLNHLRAGSAKVDMIEPAFSALARALAVGEKMEETKSYGFVFLDSDGSVNVTLARGGITYLSRDFLLSEDQVANETRFYEELKASFDFMQRASDGGQIELVYLAGSGELVFWCDFLTGVFGKQTRFELAMFPTKQDIPRNVLASLLVPIGLALRGLKQKSPLGDLTLLPPAERETKRERIKRLVGIEFLAIALFFIFLRLLILEPYAAYIAKRSVRELSPEAMADPALVNEPLTRLREIQSKFQGQIDQLNQFSEGKISMYAKLKALAKLTPESIWLDQMTYKEMPAGTEFESSGEPPPGGGKLRRTLDIKGFCYLGNADQEIQTINQWAKALTDEKVFLEGFRRATLEEVRREKFQDRDVTRFQILCR